MNRGEGFYYNTHNNPVGQSPDDAGSGGQGPRRRRRNNWEAVMEDIKKAVEACMEEIISIRRDIHRHPEIGRKEVRTAGIIREKLKEYGVDKIETPCPTATVGLIYGGAGEGKCVALRADIDALPVQEESGLPFASEIPGMMHACGHDMHASMLLGVARYYAKTGTSSPVR